MANPLNVIQQFQQAIGKGDFTAARQLLHDNLISRSNRYISEARAVSGSAQKTPTHYPTN